MTTPTRFATTADGVRVAHRRIDAERPRGHVLLLQGRGDFLDKYEDPAQRLTDMGLSAVWWDWRGQGDTRGRQADDVPRGAGHVDGFEEYLADLDAVLAAHPDLPGPRVLLGHSMGGLLALLHLLRRPGAAAAAVLLAPMLGFRGAPPLPVVRAVAGAQVRLGRGRHWAAGERWTPPDECTLAANMATSDPEAFTRLQALRSARTSGLVTGSTWGWTAAAAAAMARARRADLSAVTADVLVVSSPVDTSVDPRAHHALVARLPRGRLLEHPGRHDLLWGSATDVAALWDHVRRHLDRALSTDAVA